MTQEVQVTSLQYARAFPWLRLGRALGCAIAPLPLGMATLASLVWMLLIVPVFSVQANDFDGWVSQRLILAGDVEAESQSPVSLAPPLAAVAPWPRPGFAWNSVRQLLGILAGYGLWTVVGVAIARATAVATCWVTARDGARVRPMVTARASVARWTRTEPTMVMMTRSTAATMREAATILGMARKS